LDGFAQLLELPVLGKLLERFKHDYAVIWIDRYRTGFAKTCA